jgi:hypothetical protein
VATKKVKVAEPTRVARQVYVLNGITYVPHYSKDCFVGPGYGLNHRQHIYESTLRLNNAEPKMMLLWTPEAPCNQI